MFPAVENWSASSTSEGFEYNYTMSFLSLVALAEVPIAELSQHKFQPLRLSRTYVLPEVRSMSTPSERMVYHRSCVAIDNNTIDTV
jgi:hypothetical protein